MLLETNRRYSAQIDLNFIQRQFGNDIVRKEFEGLLFKDVKVTGEGKTRYAEGTYIGKTREMPKDNRISNVKAL